jgi:hypothetical protein
MVAPLFAHSNFVPGGAQSAFLEIFDDVYLHV